MPTGAGFASAGFSIAGYGSVDSAPAQQPGVLVDANTGLGQNARKVDPVTGRYVRDTYGRVQGMSGAQQLVMMRVGTLLNSSAVPDLGMAAPAGTIGPNALARLDNEVRTAMRDLTDQKIIEIVDVKVTTVLGSKAIRRYFSWRDLTSSTNHGGLEQTDF